MALITQSDLEKRIGRSLTADEAVSFTTINLATQAYIENLLSTGVESVTATTRLYDGGVLHLPINPCTGVTDVKYVDEYGNANYTFATNEYTVEPVNKTLKYMLRNRNAKFNKGMNNISVTAKFSLYDDTPTLNIVKNAMLDILAQIVDGKENIISESIEGYSINFSNVKKTYAIQAFDTLVQGII
jgi:hypothetical protein